MEGQRRAGAALPETFGAFDGREHDCLDYVKRNTPPGDPAAIIKAIDEFAYKTKWLMNVGDVKGVLLDNALARAKPKLVLELGTYVGYSSLRMIQKIPTDGKIVSVEYSDKVAQVARQMIEHAGMKERITVVNGYLQDKDQRTRRVLEEQFGFKPGCLDFVFLDHAKEAYLPDLKLILSTGWLRKGSVIVADNVRFPGAPDYKQFVEEREGKLFQTTHHETLLEYQTTMADLVLESICLVDNTAQSSVL
jgi:catechol O-methyltransferase